MTKKFDPKKYRDKPRVYSPVLNAPGVSKLWIWNAERSSYEPPVKGGMFYARKSTGNGRREYHLFSALEEARKWQVRTEANTSPVTIQLIQSQAPISGPAFGEIVTEWKRRCYPGLSETTRVAYDKIVKLYLGSLMPLKIREITPQRVDLWLDELKDPSSPTMQSKRRKSFDHELSVVSTILRYYESYRDDSEFRYPIKKRHKEAVTLNRPTKPKQKDLSEIEFLKFRKELKNGSCGNVLAALATVQFYQALRISEAAALYWEDVRFDFEKPWQSRLFIVRAVCWPRIKGSTSFIKSGFKNSAANDGIKEHPMFPESHEALSSLHHEGQLGLIFGVAGTHFDYRIIQYAYDSAFKRAGLPYRGTHVLRHGGCRKLLNETGDMTIAKQHLGNTDMATVQVYAQREASALTKVAHQQWERKKTETGCKWLQLKEHKQKTPQLRGVS
jgi:integrase